VGERLRAIPVPLRVILVVALIEVLAWSVVLAPLQGPDESAHYSYTQYLAETGHRPMYDTGANTVSSETGTAYAAFNLYGLVGRPSARPFWSQSEYDGWQRAQSGLTDEQRKNGSGPNAVAKNPPLYYAYESIPYRIAEGAGFLDRLWLMRVANGALFLLTVAFTWLAAAELFRSILARTAAAAAVALQPMAAFMSGVVNPDTMLATVWAAFIVLALRLVVRGFTWWRVVGVIGLAIASVLTHGRGLPLLPVAVVALALAWWHHRPAISRRWAWAGAAMLVVGLLVALKLVSARGGAYGGEINLGRNFSLREFGSFVWQFYLPKLPFMDLRVGPDYGYKQLFIERYLAGQFGSLEVQFVPRIYTLVQLAAGLGFVGLIAALVVRRRELAAHWDSFLLLLVAVVSCVGFLHLASYRAIVGGSTGDPLIVGRYLLPLTCIFGLAVAFVVTSVKRRLQLGFTAVVLSLGILLQLGALGLTFARFYA
jgi:4-amino-4-deoxy-L-arabinose transferase-like glycosyltransferase